MLCSLVSDFDRTVDKKIQYNKKNFEINHVISRCLHLFNFIVLSQFEYKVIFLCLLTYAGTEFHDEFFFYLLVQPVPFSALSKTVVVSTHLQHYQHFKLTPLCVTGSSFLQLLTGIHLNYNFFIILWKCTLKKATIQRYVQQQRVSETQEPRGIRLQEISLVLVSCELQALVGFVGIVHRCVGRYDLLFPACGSRLVLHLIHSHCVRPDSNYSLSGCVSRATKREQHGSLCKVDRGHSVRR